MEKSTKPNTFKFRPDQQLLLGSKEKGDDRKKRKSKRREKRDDTKRKNEANIGDEENTGHAPSDRKNTSRLHRWFIKNLRIRKGKDMVKKVDEGEDISTRRGRSGTIITVREEIMVEEGKRRHQKTDFQTLEMQYPEDGSYGKVCTLCLCDTETLTTHHHHFLFLTVYTGMGSGLS